MTRYATEHGAYEIDSMPGQVQVALCHGFYIELDQRGRGLAHLQKEHQNLILSELGYDNAICTVAHDNAAQKRVLELAGWNRLSAFPNTRLGGMTELWGYVVKRIREQQ